MNCPKNSLNMFLLATFLSSCVIVEPPRSDHEETCGGPTGKQCGQGLACYYQEIGTCQMPQISGTCIVPPGNTGFLCSPPNPALDNRVCGCDGNTHWDLCHAYMWGVSVLHQGPCL